MPNQVTLTFAGETKSVEDAFARTGTAAKRMSDDVDESADGFRRAGDAADEVDTKAMGFRDTLTGVQDSMAGVAALSKGPSFEGFLLLGAGIGDLGSGFYNFLIPALEKTKIATLAKAGADKVAAAGARMWAAAQWVMNASLWASPVTWIVVGIVALIAVIVLIATKTDWFSKAWRASWSWIKSAASNTWEFLKKIPGWIGTAFAKVAGFISTPYRKAFNLISDAWNATIGRLSWTVPSWIPGIGGNTISVPNLPHFHAGVGRVPGAPGSETLAVLQAGERVSSAAGAGGGATLTIDSAGARLDDLLVEVLKKAIGKRGGNVQIVLGGSA
ncbi:MAG TPA: hypothetical protein VIQ30_03390 [Pseudonocardia sp.]